MNITDVFTPATVGQWTTKMLQWSSALGLPTTSWQPGAWVRTIYAVMARGFGAQDSVISTMAQGGFLQFAAAITPDPSLDSSIVTPGWLDILADGGYNVQREPATYATGEITLTNGSASTYGPYAPGTYHIDNPTTKASYHNVNTLTIAPSTDTFAMFAADIAGIGGTSATNTITHATTSLTGVTVTNAGSLVGANAQSNATLVQLCRAKQAARSPNGPRGSYEFFALEAAGLLADLDPSVTIVPITRVLVERNKATGTVTTTVASADGDVPGVALLAVIDATNTSPVEIQTVSAHGLNTGDWATVSGVRGNGGANVTSTITVTAADKFTLDDSVGTGAYTSDGVVEGGDLGQVDRILQANTVPDGVTAITESATAAPLDIVIDVYVPVLYVETVTDPITALITDYIATSPIGGYTDPVGAYTNVIPLDAVIGVAYAACILAAGQSSVAQQVTATINGFAANFGLGTHDVASLNSLIVNVHAV